MVYTVYKTTNLLTSEYYIGVHKTGNPDDKYLGSGLQIVKAIKHDGEQNFKKVVLFEFNSPGMALLKEEELLRPVVGIDPLCYNMSIGGKGGLATRGGYKRPVGKKLTEQHRANLKIARNKRVVTEEELIRLRKNSEAMRGVPLTLLHKEKLSNAFLNTILINDSQVSKRIRSSETIPEGWIRGRLKLKYKRVRTVLVSQEEKDKISRSLKLLRNTPQEKKRASENMLRVWEERRRISEAKN